MALKTPRIRQRDSTERTVRRLFCLLVPLNEEDASVLTLLDPLACALTRAPTEARTGTREKATRPVMRP
jgi:hypothetical protein